MQQPITGMLWYSREDYPSWVALYSDREKLHATYEEWLQAAETGIRHHQQKGTRIIKIPVRPVDFALYCKARGIEINRAARSAFVHERLKEMYDRGEVKLP